MTKKQSLPLGEFSYAEASWAGPTSEAFLDFLGVPFGSKDYCRLKAFHQKQADDFSFSSGTTFKYTLKVSSGPLVFTSESYVLTLERNQAGTFYKVSLHEKTNYTLQPLAKPLPLAVGGLLGVALLGAGLGHLLPLGLTEVLGGTSSAAYGYGLLCPRGPRRLKNAFLTPLQSGYLEQRGSKQDYYQGKLPLALMTSPEGFIFHLERRGLAKDLGLTQEKLLENLSHAINPYGECLFYLLEEPPQEASPDSPLKVVPCEYFYESLARLAQEALDEGLPEVALTVKDLAQVPLESPKVTLALWEEVQALTEQVSAVRREKAQVAKALEGLQDESHLLEDKLKEEEALAQVAHARASSRQYLAQELEALQAGRRALEGGTS